MVVLCIDRDMIPVLKALYDICSAFDEKLSRLESRLESILVDDKKNIEEPIYLPTI